jgi:hypothetical protein
MILRPRRSLLKSASLLSVTAALPSVFSGCAMPMFVDAPRNAGSRPRVKVGDEWTYTEINRYNNLQTGTVTQRATTIDPIVRIANSAKVGDRQVDRAEEIYDSLWTIKQEPAYDVVQIFERPLPFLPANLEAGYREVFQTSYKVDGINRLFYWRSQLFAAGWERVQVPAGEFVALRVERTSWFAHFDTFRSDSVRRDTLWYSPLVNRWVRREWTGEYRGPNSRRLPQREDWVRWDLLSYKKAA